MLFTGQSDIMLKQPLVAILFAALTAGVKAQTTIPISAADKDEIVQAHNYVCRRVVPTAANMEDITVH